MASGTASAGLKPFVWFVCFATQLSSLDCFGLLCAEIIEQCTLASADSSLSSGRYGLLMGKLPKKAA